MNNGIAVVLTTMLTLVAVLLIVLGATLAPYIGELYIKYGWRLCRAKRHRSLAKCWRSMYTQAGKCTNCPLAHKWRDIE